MSILQPSTSDRITSWYEISVWTVRRRATIFGNPVSLTPIEHRILLTLVDAQGLNVPRDTLFKAVYGNAPFGYHKLKQNLSRVRKILEGSNTRIKSHRLDGISLECISRELARVVVGHSRWMPRQVVVPRSIRKNAEKQLEKACAE